MTVTLGVGGFDANLSPDAFRLSARDFYAASLGVRRRKFSTVRYFCLARAMELALKSSLFATRDREAVRKFGHDLEAVYLAQTNGPLLSVRDFEVLKSLNAVYSDPTPMYFSGEDALRGFKRFPPLAATRRVARRLLDLLAPALRRH